MKTYLNENVMDAAKKRIETLFDNFQDINISVSSGKDSLVLWHLCVEEAEKRNRKVVTFFLDQEAEYKATVDVIKNIMAHPAVIPAWYQVPCYMTNATSYSEYFLYAWGPDEQWMREKDPIAIHHIDEDYPQRFYKFFPWYEKQNPDAAYLIGLRADESLTRYRAVTKHPGWNDLPWSSGSEPSKFYPIYDWTVYDIWKYIYDHDLKYNKMYDLMYLDGQSIYKGMRISNLIHEKSFKCLSSLPKYEPDTYEKLCHRIGGIATAARYSMEKLVFSNNTLPTHYKTWLEFRDFLLKNIPEELHRIRFRKRFENQPKTERTFKAQVGQLLVNDYEGSLQIDTKKAEKTRRLKEKWMELL